MEQSLVRSGLMDSKANGSRAQTRPRAELQTRLKNRSRDNLRYRRTTAGWSTPTTQNEAVNVEMIRTTGLDGETHTTRERGRNQRCGYLRLRRWIL